VAWSAPSVGTPTQYAVTVYELYASAANRTAYRFVGSVLTPHTSVQLPAGILAAGKRYFFLLEADGQKPGSAGLDDAYGSTSSGVLEP
jgi:hypothetical protein